MDGGDKETVQVYWSRILSPSSQHMEQPARFAVHAGSVETYVWFWLELIATPGKPSWRNGSASLSYDTS